MLRSEGLLWSPWICLGYFIMAFTCSQLPTKQDTFCKAPNLPVWEGHQEGGRRTNSERIFLSTYIGEFGSLINSHLVLT